MPCFQGIAVSIHTPDGPIPEYSVQRNGRMRRITSYIPVPPPKFNDATKLPEQSTFAISITLLTPGNTVPYSTPKPTKDDPYPRPKIVGGSPYDASSRFNTIAGTIAPYQPQTASPNETIAAYIYFDGRIKEEVATLLRRGEETWVNSRWVGVPESEGGGLAEREFLFREVGLERWLNGLDLQGKDMDIAARIKKRREKLERRRRIKKEEKDSDDESDKGRRRQSRNGVLRYGNDANAPVESISDDDSLLSDSDSDDEPPMPEAAGQIKVALYRVLASGEIKRGEYSPHFDAHDDDDLDNGPREDTNADVDHTTSFAKPKTLDPKSISTQTVSPIDQADKPYAVFTFLYRGEKQLKKMSILTSGEKATPAVDSKRKSSKVDFGTLQPLKSASTVKNFAGYRDNNAAKHSVMRKLDSKRKGSDADSDMDDDEDQAARPTVEETDEKDESDSKRLLSPEDVARQQSLADGVKKINLLKRQASAEPLSAPEPSLSAQKSPSPGTTLGVSPAPESAEATAASAAPAIIKTSAIGEVSLDSTIGSPFKRTRAGDEKDVDVSGAKRASEVFSSTLFNSAAKTESSTSTDVAKKNGTDQSMAEEEL